MANTGYKVYTILERYFTDTGELEGTTKSNDQADPDYVAPVYDTSSCPVPDTTQPIVTGLQKTGSTSSSISISWSSSDNIGVTSHKVWIQKSGVWYEYVPDTSTTHTFTGLSGGTTYAIYVEAFDAAGNSGISGVVNYNTAAPTYSQSLGVSISAGSGACDDYDSGFRTTKYTNTVSFLDASQLWTTSSASTYASAGYYANGVSWRYWSGTSFGSEGACSVKP